jgi:hypothetical protein
VTTPIYVMAHDRPESLLRLLDSLAAADVARGTSLYISIDPGGARQGEVEAVATKFVWQAGTLDVAVAPRRRGLVAHFHALGDLAAAVGDFVLLEDDLEVGPAFHRWAGQALAAYRDDPGVTGISLNALWFNGFSSLPFVPMLDGSDVFFAQVPWYQGMVFTSDWWRAWREDARTDSAFVDLPPMYGELGDEEWFGDMAAFLAATGRTFVFPRRSHSTNHAEAGVHFDRRSSWFQVPVEQRAADWRLSPLSESLARYDAWLEIDPEVLRSAGAIDLPDDIVVDLTGQRRSWSWPDQWVLTTNQASQTNRRWGMQRHPIEANMLAGQAGTGISLCSASNIRLGRVALAGAAAARRSYAAHGQPTGVRGTAIDAAARLASRLGRRRW